MAKACPDCRGNGSQIEDDGEKTACNLCDGQGEVIDCEACGGDGFEHDDDGNVKPGEPDCDVCWGAGMRPAEAW